MFRGSSFSIARKVGIVKVEDNHYDKQANGFSIEQFEVSCNFSMNSVMLLEILLRHLRKQVLPRQPLPSSSP